MKRWLQLRCLVPMMLALVLLALSAEPAHAQLAAVDCKQFAGVTNRIVSCVTETITNAAGVFFDPDTGFYPMVSRAIAATVTLAVIIYGILAAYGMVEKVGRDTLVLLIKVSCVTFFCTNADYMYDKVTQFMNASAEAVVFFVPQTGAAEGDIEFDRLTCLQRMRDVQAQNQGGRIVGPWISIDCIIDSVIGIRTDAANGTNPDPGTDQYFRDNFSATDKGLSRGMLYVFFSTMQTSVVGLMLGVIGLLFIFGMVMLVIQALFTFLAGYLGVAFLMVISPIFIPLVLFRQTKEQYFDKWVKLLLAFSLQPVFMLAFITFSVAAMDLAMFSGDYSIMYRMAGSASRAPGFSLNQYLLSNEIIVKKPAEIFQRKGSQNEVIPVTKPGGGVGAGLGLSDCTTSFMNKQGLSGDDLKKQIACKSSGSIRFWHNSFDWAKLAQVRMPSVQLEDGTFCTYSPPPTEDEKAKCNEQIANEVLGATILCAVVAFVLNQMLKVVPNLIVDLIGDYSQTPNLFSRVGRSVIPGSSQLASTTRAFESLVGKR